MYSLALLAAAAALCAPGARALTLGRPADDAPENARGLAGIQEACLAAAGLPDCPAGHFWGGGGVAAGLAQTGCLDAAQLAEDMGELGFGAEGCARKLQTGEDARGDPLQMTDPKPGEVAPASVPHTKPVIWVHIHKSMGTFVYSLAKMNHENVIRPSFNGNWWPYDTPDAVRKGKAGHKDCKARAGWFAETNATWGQIEHELNPVNLCHDDFNYGILLRDPNKLAISKASMEEYRPDQVISSMSCLEGGGGDGKNSLQYKCDRAAPWIHDWKLYWFFDNFLVRTLGGSAVWNLPAGEVTEEHARQAIERLSRFEVVMFGEDFEEKEHLQKTIGWDPKYFETAFKRPSSHVIEFTDEQEARARQTNRFDYMVHDHFRAMSIKQRVKRFQ